MLKVLLVVLAAQPALPCALQHETSAVPAGVDAKVLRDILVGLHSGGEGLLADAFNVRSEKAEWHPYNKTDKGRKWDEYQAALTRDLLTAQPPSTRGRSLKVLVVTAVADNPRERLLWEDTVHRLVASSTDPEDVFHWALFHHDNTTENWTNSTLFNDPKVVVLNHVGPGCKLQNWAKLPQELTEQYDYLWLVDSDLRFDFFRWDLYRAVLKTLNPLVSQPSILPPWGGGQSSAVKYLPIHSSCREGFPVAMELPRSEVQAPLISTHIWRAAQLRVRNGPGTSDWYMDAYWDVIAHAARNSSCGQVGPVLVNAAPLWHQAWKTLGIHGSQGRGTCPAWKGSEKNRRPVSPEEMKEVGLALLRIGCKPQWNFSTTFQVLFSEQSNKGQRLCDPDRDICRKWIDGAARNPSSDSCFSDSDGVEVAQAKHGMVAAKDTEHVLGGLQVGIYHGVPETTNKREMLRLEDSTGQDRTGR